MKARSSRRDFIRTAALGAPVRSSFGSSGARGASPSVPAGRRSVDRRRLGRTGAEVSILSLGLGGGLTRGYAARSEAGQALVESAPAQSISFWDTARSHGPSESMITVGLTRRRDRVFLASKSEARDYDGFRRDLERSLQALRTSHLDLYQVHDLRPHERGNLRAIASEAVRAARADRELVLADLFRAGPGFFTRLPD